jgi:hypothetical protein
VDEDDGSWESEEISDDEVVKINEANRQQTQNENQDPQITAVPTATTTKKKASPSEESSSKHTRQQQLLEEAAREAQRQRELFAKVPVPQRSWSTSSANNQLGRRTRSGLLSMLMNPDPGIFPPGHPYRTSFSSADFSALSRGSGVGRQGEKVDVCGKQAPPVLQTSKSAVALPVAAQINALSGGDGNGVQRPKGRPEGQEMEESESGEENADDTIQVSWSVAQQRLAMLAASGRVGTNLTATTTAPTVRNDKPTAHTATLRYTHSNQRPHPQRPTLLATATAPIPLGHPYNLPAPAPPSTPRTTRRQMLQTELSESLRRNLLWERKVSNVVMRGGRRQSSSGAIPGGVGFGGLRPLTSMNAGGADAKSGRDGAAEREGEGALAAIVRHRSWADDYHTSGW